MTPQRKLIYVINHMDWFWTHRLQLAQGAQAQGWAVYIAAPGAGSDANLAVHGFTPLDLPAAPLAQIRALSRFFKTQNPDLIHAITLKCVFFTGLAAWRRSKQKIVYTIAGLGYLFSSGGAKPLLLRTAIAPFLKTILKRPRTSIIFQNSDDQFLMISQNYVLEKNACVIPGSGVDLTEFHVSPEPDTGRPLILLPTRLIREKGIFIFAEAAKILHERHIKARFQIAGGLSPGNPRSLTEADMRGLTAAGHVEWLGHCRDMRAVYAQSAIVAYPSWYREGVPKALLEAAASGRPIVATDHPGCREAVHHGENGFLVPARDALALANAIETLLRDPAIRRVMGEKSRLLAQSAFDVRSVVEKTLGVYTLLMEEQDRP